MMRRLMGLVLWLLLFGVPGGMVQAGEGSGLEAALTTTTGQTIRLTDFKGKVVLVNFWATWCPPCLEEIPALVRLHRTYADKGLVVVGINYMEKPDRERLQRFIEEHGIDYPIVLGEVKQLQGVARTLGGVFALPVTKVLNRSGALAAGHIGGLNFDEMQKLVEPWL